MATNVYEVTVTSHMVIASDTDTEAKEKTLAYLLKHPAMFGLDARWVCMLDEIDKEEVRL